MKDIVNTIKTLKENEYYFKLIEELVVGGLLDIIEDELKDGKIDYLPLLLNALKFLNDNKSKYKNFSSRTFENILILSVDEILTKKFNVDLDEKQIDDALQLIKNSFLFVSLSQWIKDRFIILYYDYILKLNCFKKVNTDVKIINNATSEQDSI